MYNLNYVMLNELKVPFANDFAPQIPKTISSKFTTNASPELVRDLSPLHHR